MGIIDSLKWRYATKKYAEKSISNSDLDIILDSILLAPTSLGLQAFEIEVLDKSSVKKQLLSPACHNQPQILDASHIIIFNAWKSVELPDIEQYMQRISATRGTPTENLEGFKNNIIKFIGNMSDSELFAWSSMQTYIALGIAMATAAELRIDTTPMEGFNRQAVDVIINPENEKLSCSVILAVGYRNAETDLLANLAKVRKSRTEMIKLG